MNDSEKIIEALENALIEEDKVGLVLQQIQERTGLSREKVKMALVELMRENVIMESDLTIGGGKTSRKIYLIRKGFIAMKNTLENKGNDVVV